MRSLLQDKTKKKSNMIWLTWGNLKENRKNMEKRQIRNGSYGVDIDKLSRIIYNPFIFQREVDPNNFGL